MLSDFFNNRLLKIKWEYVIPDEDKNTLFEKTDTYLWLFANYTIIFFIVLSLILVCLDTIPSINENYKSIIFTLDLIISSVFLIEYIYRWYNSDEKIKFPFKLMNFFDLLSFLPFFILIILNGIWSYYIFALFRIFKVFRIFELIERIPIISKLVNGINKHKTEYLAAIFLILIILTIFSTFVYFIELKWWNKELFNSIPTTFRWAVVTMTTTGYWDMIPASVLWKIIASMLMFLWPILIAILSSITVIVFLDSTNMIDLNKKLLICKKCFRPNQKNSKYCNNCWNKI